MKQIGLVIVLAMLATPVQAQDYGAWQHDTQTSQLDNTTKELFVIASSNEVANSIGAADHASMAVICNKGETQVLFMFNAYMGSRPVNARYKIGTGTIKNAALDVSTNGRAFGWWNGTGVAVLKAMANQSKFVIAAPPYDEGPKEAVFDISGINAVIATTRKACGW